MNQNFYLRFVSFAVCNVEVKDIMYCTISSRDDRNGKHGVGEKIFDLHENSVLLGPKMTRTIKSTVLEAFASVTWTLLFIVIVSIWAFFPTGTGLPRESREPSGWAMKTFVNELQQQFPTQNLEVWAAIKRRFGTTTGKRVTPHIFVVATASDGVTTATCLVSKLANYIKSVHGDRDVHVLDINSLDAVADAQHLHVPLFLRFALEKNHALILFNAQKLKAAGAAQLKPLFSYSLRSTPPTAAFFMTILEGDANTDNPKSKLEEAWIANGWQEENVKEMLHRTRSTLLYIVTERRIPCEDSESSLQQRD